jgi:hypothetical protein
VAVRVARTTADPVDELDPVAVTSHSASMGVAAAAPELDEEPEAATATRAVRRAAPVDVDDPEADATNIVEYACASE